MLRAVLSATAISTAGLIGGMVLGALRQVVAARILGPEGFGVIALAESFENVLIRVAPLGLTLSLPLILARAVAARDRAAANRALGTAGVLGAPFAVAPGLLLLLAGPQIAGLLGAPDAAPALQVWGLVVVGLTMTQLASAVPRGLLRMGAATAIRDVLPNALLLAGLLAAVAVGLDLPELAVGYAVAALVAGALAVALAMRWALAAGLRPAASRTSVRPLLGLTGATVTMVVAGQIMRQVNVPILTAVTDVHTVGIFSSAMFLATTTEAIFTSLVMVYMPYANKLLVESGPQALAGIQPAIGRWTFLISVFPIAVLSAFAEPMVVLIFGADFSAAALPLRVVLIGLLVRAVVGPRESVQMALDRPRDISIAFVLALIAAVGAAVVLTPILGLLGSAISFATGFAVRAVISEVQLRRVLPDGGMQPRELAAAATIGLFALAALMAQTLLGVLLPFVAAMGVAFVFVATLDDTDREVLSASRFTRWRRARGR